MVDHCLRCPRLDHDLGSGAHRDRTRYWELVAERNEPGAAYASHQYDTPRNPLHRPYVGLRNGSITQHRSSQRSRLRREQHRNGQGQRKYARREYRLSRGDHSSGKCERPSRSTVTSSLAQLSLTSSDRCKRTHKRPSQLTRIAGFLLVIQPISREISL
jgi:hypothetical protein